MANIRGVHAFLALVGAAAVGALGPSMFESRTGKVQQASAVETEARLLALESEVATLGDPRLNSPRDARGDLLHDTERPSADEGETEGPRRPDTEPTGFKSNEDLEDAYEAVYQRGAAHTDWSRRVETEFARVVTENLPSGSVVDSFECRADFCRLEAVHDDVARNNEFLLSLFSMEHGGALMDSSGGFRSAGVTAEADGKQRHVIFIARRGVQLALEPHEL